MSIWTRISAALSSLARGEPLSVVFDHLRGAPDPERSVGFTIAVIALGAKLAKADGQVTRDEVSAFRRVFTLPPGEEENAARVSAHVAARMAALRHPLLRDTRANGLFFGAEFLLDDGQPATRFCADLVEGMVARGVLMNVIGTGRNILKIRPPMPFAIENADILMDRLEEALTATQVSA